MRISRIISGLIAFALIGLLPAAAPATASEGPTHARSGTAAAAAPAARDLAARVKPSRRIGIHINEPKRNKFFIHGQVRPKYQGRFLTVQRKLKGEKHWDKFKVVKTDRHSKYRTQVAEKRSTGTVFYRVTSRKTDSFKLSHSKRVYIRTFYS